MGESPTYPIVLAHGIARFDELTNRIFKIGGKDQDDGLHYFRNIRTHLESKGFIVRHSDVEWAANVKTRSKTLHREVVRILQELDAEKVHIIAHSMGGLDARQMLFDTRHEKFFERIASLTTIGTPHHGTSAADVLANAVITKGSILGIDISGFADLTTEACSGFNREKRNWEQDCGVRFRAYAGRQSFLSVFSPLKATWAIIHSREGDNDGLVPVSSARWEDAYSVEPVVEADHLNLIGWWEPADLWHGESPFELEGRIKALYLSIAKNLAAEFPVS